MKFRLPFRLPWMSRSDRRRWNSASTVAELGELVALWLEGELDSRPGYAPRYGPDEETTDLIPTLAACNRAGFITESSQPGTDPETGYDGATWRQRACVSGFIPIANKELLTRMWQAADAAGLRLIVHGIGWLSVGPRDGMAVTERDGEPVTLFGGRLKPADVRLIWSAGGVRAPVLQELLGAFQVTLVDTAWGPHTRLWDFLDTLTGRHQPDQPEAELEDDGDDSYEYFDDTPRECSLCGAPYFHSGAYCSIECEEIDLDADDDGQDDDGDFPSPVVTFLDDGAPF